MVARSVLLRGALTHRCRSLPNGLQPLKHAVERLAAAADTGLADLPEVAYRYVLGRPLPHTALVGAAEVAEVEAAVRFAERGPLSPEIIDRIRAVSMQDENLLNPATWGDFESQSAARCRI